MQNNNKSPSEIARMRKAAAITDEVFDSVLSALREGVTEKEIADLVLAETVRLGGSGVSFDTIVAFGESGAEPHHVPTDKRLEKGMLVTVDMGAVYESCDADFTRTVAFGEPSEKQREVYAVVLEAQRRALAAVRPGVPASTVHHAVEACFLEYGYESGCNEKALAYGFTHATGHGVGLEIHEGPRVSPLNRRPLRRGNVVSVEPGLYDPDWGGIRLEDLVAVTGTGCRNFNTMEKDLEVP